MKHKWTLIIGVVTILTFISCNTAQRLTYAEQKEHTNLRHPLKKEGKKDTASSKEALPQKVTIVSNKNEEGGGGEQQFYFSFDSIQNIEMDEIVVTASTKSVAERNGQLNLDFVVTIPAVMMKQDWKMVIKPILDNKGEIRQLDSMVIHGKQNWYFQTRKDRQIERQQRLEEKLASRKLNTWNKFPWEKKKEKDNLDSIQNHINKMLQESRKVGMRLDTIMESGQNYDYYYSQQMSSENLATNVKIYMESYIVNCDDRLFPLMPSDTIKFYIASFIQFLDNTPRYVRKIIKRKVTDKMTANIQFAAGKYVLNDTLANNEEEFAKVKERIKNIAEGNEFIIDSLTITAYSSPEGSVQTNAILAKNRANSLKEYLYKDDVDNILPGDDYTIIGTEAEDWRRLAGMVYNTPEIINAREILEIIQTEENLDKREMLIRNKFPQDYKYMRENLYPQLRAVDFVFHLARRNMVEDVMFTDEIDTEYADAIQLMKDRKYKQAMPKLLEYRDWNTAICYMSLGYNAMALQIIGEMEKTSDTEYLMSILYARENNIEKAIDCYLSACRMDESKAMRGEMDPELAELIKAYGLNKEFGY